MTGDEKMRQVPAGDSEEEPIYGVVADILNEREVVLNVGKKDGVDRGMRFAILDDLDYEVKDPKTGESLGKIPPRVKVRVKIVELTEKLSIARTYEARTKNIGGRGWGGLSAVEEMMRPPQYVEKPVTFRIGEGATYFKKIVPEESIVQIGDRVRQIVTED